MGQFIVNFSLTGIFCMALSYSLGPVSGEALSVLLQVVSVNASSLKEV